MSVKGTSVTLLVDCREIGALVLNRTVGSSPANTGVLLIGQQLLNENAFFTGDIQQLLLIPDPDAAYEVCSKYMPDCRFPLSTFQQSNGFEMENGAEASGRPNDTGQVCSYGIPRKRRQPSKFSLSLKVDVSPSIPIQHIRGPQGPRGYTGLICILKRKFTLFRVY